MKKRQCIKTMKESFVVNQMFFSDYDLKIINDNKQYHAKFIHTSPNHQIVINSNDIWEVKRGRLKGIRFETISSEIINFKEFNKLDNKIIIFSAKPNKVLKVLNESDLLDVSGERVYNDLFVSYDVSQIIEHVKAKK